MSDEDKKRPQIWTVTERGLRDVRATPPDAWPGVRGVTIIGTLWGGDALAVSSAVVRMLSSVLAAATPGQGVEALIPGGDTTRRQLVADLERESARAETFTAAHLEQTRLVAALGQRVDDLERANLARRVDVTELRRALVSLLAEVACGQARISSVTASPACERAQDALDRYGVRSPTPAADVSARG